MSGYVRPRDGGGYLRDLDHIHSTSQAKTRALAASPQMMPALRAGSLLNALPPTARTGASASSDAAAQNNTLRASLLEPPSFPIFRPFPPRSTAVFALPHAAGGV